MKRCGGIVMTMVGLVACGNGSNSARNDPFQDVPVDLPVPQDGIQADAKDPEAHRPDPTGDAGLFVPDAPDLGPEDAGEVDTGVQDPGASDPGAQADLFRDSGQPEDPGTPPVTPPDGPGPHQTHSVKGQFTREGRTTRVVAHVPDGSGPWPLVVFLPGFQASSDLYQGTVDRIANHGFVAVRAEPPGGLFDVNHVEMALDAVAVVDWALNPEGPLGGLVDPERIAMTGHSLGGKIAVMAAFRDPRIRAVLGLDPVNGGNPITGYSPSLPDIVPDEVGSLAIPLGFVGEDWSATHATFGQSCAPADQNYRTFYDAASAAPWRARWTLGGADHMDFVDDPSTCGFVCSVCPDGPGPDADQVDGARTIAVAFLRRHLAGEAAMEDWLTGALVPGVVTETAHVP